MKPDELTKARGEVIEKFINLETIINAIISQHYFKKVRQDFFFELLYNQSFNFGLRISILEKIVPNIDKIKIEKLRKLNAVRNYFAHCGPEIFPTRSTGIDKEKGRVPHPADYQKSIDFDNLYQEFIKTEPEISVYLGQIFTNMSGILEKS
jgi:hypothetical protein